MHLEKTLVSGTPVKRGVYSGSFTLSYICCGQSILKIRIDTIVPSTSEDPAIHSHTQEMNHKPKLRKDTIPANSDLVNIRTPKKGKPKQKTLTFKHLKGKHGGVSFVKLESTVMQSSRSIEQSFVRFMQMHPCWLHRAHLDHDDPKQFLEFLQRVSDCAAME